MGVVIVLKALALNLFSWQNCFVKIMHLQLAGELAKLEEVATEFYGVISDLYCFQWQVKWAQHSTDWCSGACISWVCCSVLHGQKRSLSTAMFVKSSWIFSDTHTIDGVAITQSYESMGMMRPWWMFLETSLSWVVLPLAEGACVVPTSVSA